MTKEVHDRIAEGLQEAIDHLKGGWRPIESAPTGMGASGVSVSPRLLLWVPPYGFSTGHFDQMSKTWRCHSVLNRAAQPTYWMLPDPPGDE